MKALTQLVLPAMKHQQQTAYQWLFGALMHEPTPTVERVCGGGADDAELRPLAAEGEPCLCVWDRSDSQTRVHLAHVASKQKWGVN